MKKTLAVLMMLLLLAMLIVSCEADSPVIHKVTFNSDNGSEAKVESVIDGEKTVKPSDPVMTGYTFLGWYDGDTLFDFESPVKQDYSLTAKWQIQTFTVSFDVNGGEGSYESQTINYGDKIDTTKVSDPTRTGHTFLGWYDGSEKFDIYNTPITGNITLTAKWDYKVTFDPDNGEAPVYFYIESARTIAAGTVADPEKERFAFKGWYKEDGTKFEFGTTQVTADLKLTAKWNKTYICIVDYNRTDPDIVNEYYEVEDGYEFHFTDKDSNGYDWDITKPAKKYNENLNFVGWYYNGKLYKPNTDDWNKTITVEEPVTLTAVWDDKTFYTVTFVDDDEAATVLLTATVEDGKKVYITEGWTPYKKGYTFVEWDKDDGTKFDFDSTNVTDNIKLKAKWEFNYYTVTFDTKGGSPATYTQSVKYNEKVPQPSTDPKKSYGHFQPYDFLGWYNGSKKFDFSTPITENITLTAKWGYTVTFYYSDGGSPFASQVVEEGSFVTKPEDPKRDGYLISKWTSDSEGVNEYKFGEKSNYTKIYVQWIIPEAGDTVQLGAYPSDYAIESLRGNPISWKVLEVVKDANGNIERVLLFSENVLENLQYRSPFYSGSSIRGYLTDNSENGFIKKYGLSGVDMCNVDISREITKVGEGNEKVFLLSSTEAGKQLSFYVGVKIYLNSDDARKATYNGSRCSWWVRSTYSYSNFVEIFYATENGDVQICKDYNNSKGLRPAFWIDMNVQE